MVGGLPSKPIRRLPELVKLGVGRLLALALALVFATPSVAITARPRIRHMRSDLRKYLGHALEGLPSKTLRSNTCMCCPCAHVVNMLWRSVVEHMESLAPGKELQWTT